MCACFGFYARKRKDCGKLKNTTKKSVENTCRKGWEIKTPSNNERKWKLVGTASQQHEKSNKIQ